MDLDYLKRIEDAFKKRGHGLQWHMMSGYIIVQNLGLDWYQKNCALGGQRVAPFDQNQEEDVLALDYHINLVRLGHMLFLLRDVPGFEHLLADMARRDFEPVFFELHAAALLVQNGYSIQFVRPTGVKGQDYDLEADIDGHCVAVEVKTRRAGPINNTRALKNALSDAKKQLSRTKPGVICVAVTTEYGSVKGAQHNEKEVERTLYDFLSGTKRVNGIIVFWHRWSGNPPVCMTMMKEYRNYNARNHLGREWLINPASSMFPTGGVQNGFPSFMSEAQQGAPADAAERQR